MLLRTCRRITSAGIVALITVLTVTPAMPGWSPLPCYWRRLGWPAAQPCCQRRFLGNRVHRGSGEMSQPGNWCVRAYAWSRYNGFCRATGRCGTVALSSNPTPLVVGCEEL
jgi:hypothetical protein